MTREELLAEFDNLKAHVADFAQPRVLGDEIVEADGARRGMFETVENGEEAVVGHIHHYIDDAAAMAATLAGRKPAADPAAAAVAS